ncbi:alpha-N-acetylglucosaminidase-NAGLU [Acrasis kona]|uniref:Alpha-N-acetylglucosaminidase-NAGLU n=1 Tax=Acrasis kona TaxID=1008807 RepID=A0AAW2YYX6_9EUKA
MIKQVFIVALLISIALGVSVHVNDPSVDVAKGLVFRLLPDHVNIFKFEVIPPPSGEKEYDVYELETSTDGLIIIRGNNAGSMAAALNHYLKYHCFCQVSWGADNLDIPKPHPKIKEKIRVTTIHKHRYYMNTCTHGYSTVWWDWKRWEREIDWMALNSINAPLMFTGQEKIWQETYDELKISTKGFFSGPAFLPWNRMGNLIGWAGPLSSHWLSTQLDLAKQIVKREREFGMKPILPAFNGYVPPRLNETYPSAKVVQMKQWGAFPGTYFLDPLDPLFQRIGVTFLSKLSQALNGTDHLYNADPFNEMTPPSKEEQYLSKVSSSIYSSMYQVDSHATWIMQAWFLAVDDFWKPPVARALLNAVPRDNLIMLDLYAEVSPVWTETSEFYDHHFIWCMLHNFGGRPGLYGKLPDVNKMLFKSISTAKNTMSGIGLSMEAIENNPIAYDFVTDMTWRREQVADMNEWVNDYADRRYGLPNKKSNDDVALAREAWRLLLSGPYNCSTDQMGASGSVVAATPGLNITGVSFAPLFIYYDVKSHLESRLINMIWLIVGMQCLSALALDVYKNIQSSFASKNVELFRKESEKLKRIMFDMEKLASTNKNFMLGTWTSSAKKWAGGDELEKSHLESNARLLVTTWNSPKWGAWEYAYRMWSGIIMDLYVPRWDIFFDECEEALVNNVPFDKERFNNRVTRNDWAWVYSDWEYTDQETGDTLEVIKQIYDYYFY